MMSRFTRFIALLPACLLGCALAVQAGPPASGKGDELVAQGRARAVQGKTQEALELFRQAAATGNIDGAFLAGDTLLKAARDCQGRERILKAAGSLEYLFVAATNLQPQACADLSDALQNGIGVRKNPAAAYAWMKLAADRETSFRTGLDQLAVQFSPAEIQQGQELAREYHSKHWPADLGRPVDENDVRLRIQGITFNETRPMVVINSEPFAVGDSEDVRPANGPKNNPVRLSIRCLEIGEDYVLVSVAGEPRLKLLLMERQFSSR